MTCTFKVIHYCLKMLLKTFERNLLKYINLILLILYQHLHYHGNHVLKKSEIELELLTDIHRLLMVGKGIRGGIRHAIHRYAASSNKHIKIIIKTKN